MRRRVRNLLETHFVPRGPIIPSVADNEKGMEYLTNGQSDISLVPV